MARSRDQLWNAADEMALHAIAIVLDLVHPAPTYRHLLLEGRKAGFHDAGKLRGLAPGSVRAMKDTG
jgi:hypothetical protein